MGGIGSGSKSKFTEEERAERNREAQRRWREANRERKREQSRKSYQKNPERQKTYNRNWCKDHQEQAQEIARRNSWKRLGIDITHDQYLELLAEQNGVCAICGGSHPTRALSVDHSHEDGHVRGLLCGKCNTALGLLNDDPELMGEALSYLCDRM